MDVEMALDRASFAAEVVFIIVTKKPTAFRRIQIMSKGVEHN